MLFIGILHLQATINSHAFFMNNQKWSNHKTTELEDLFFLHLDTNLWPVEMLTPQVGPLAPLRIFL